MYKIAFIIFNSNQNNSEQTFAFERIVFLNRSFTAIPIIWIRYSG